MKLPKKVRTARDLDRACMTLRHIANHWPGCGEANALVAGPQPPLPPTGGFAHTMIIQEPTVTASNQLLIDHTIDPNHNLRRTTIAAATSFQTGVATVVEMMESQLEGADEPTQAEINSVLEYLYHKVRSWQNKKALAQHGINAHARLEELLNFNGSRGAWDMLDKVSKHEDPGHPFFVKGVNSSRQRSLRVLIKVGLLNHMLRHGALDQSGVSFNVWDAQEMSNEAYFMKGGKKIQIQLSDITGTQSNIGFFKIVELSHKFETVIERYKFNNIPGASAHFRRRFLHKFADVVLDEKRRQMGMTLHCGLKLPWKVRDTLEMPVVIWLRKGGQ